MSLIVHDDHLTNAGLLGWIRGSTEDSIQLSRRLGESGSYVHIQ